jgi:type III pantothenate kinase
MILTIDIGNSTTKFGVFDKNKLIARHTIPTIRQKSADEIAESIGKELSFNFAGVIISSVVPELNESFQKLSETYFNQTAVFVNHDFDFGFTNCYEQPESVGIDRLITAFAAIEKIGKPCIVCGFGTATTIDAINSKNEYLGGIITAGIGLLADSLHQRTSKLPKIELRKPAKLIGNTTISAIQSGVYFGYISLVDGLIEKMKTELGEEAKVIATGGYANLISESATKIDVFDDTLMLEGLSLLFTKIKE